MLPFLRANPGLLVVAVLLFGGAIVCTLVGLFMARAGASLRPVYWFAGFFALVVLPQLAGHLWKARHAPKPAPVVVADTEISAAPETVAPPPEVSSWFGPDVDPQLVVDVRNIPGGAFASAEIAQFAALPDGDTVLLARFGSYLSAEKAWIQYLRDSGLNQLPGQGDSQRGFAVARPAGDRAYVLHMGTMVGVWTGADDDAIRRRMLAGGFEIPRRAPLAKTAASIDIAATAAADSTPRSRTVHPAVIGVALAGYLFLVVLYFFKGAAWAGTSRAQAGSTPVPTTELASRLEAINALDVPFQVERGARSDEFIATWRYADAKWVDLARARGLRRTFRIRLTLDEQRGVVRATDYAASTDWSLGRGGASLEWKAALGIVFFHYEHQRVFGLQLDERGRPTAALSYAYTFNLAEMKSPLIEAVTRAGWTWRPTVWDAPGWLRWLTE